VVGPTWLVRNVVQGYKSNVLKVNNEPTGWILVYHTTGIPLPGTEWAGATAMSPPLPFGPFVSRNNIFQAHYYVFEYMQASTHAGVDLDYDGLWTDDLEGVGRFLKWLDVRYDDIAALKASGTIEPNGFQVQPVYQDEPNGDLTLGEGNGLVDVGEPIDGINTDHIVGAGPDVGAYERGGIVPGPDDGGATFPDAGAGGADGGGVGGTGSGASGTGASSAAGAEAGEDSGCGCRAAGASVGGWGAALGLLLAAAALGRRRRADDRSWADVEGGGP
jgi:MYXO-CTERM domain-containing protein